MVVIGVEILLVGIKLECDKPVGRVAIRGGVREAKVRAVAPWGEFDIGGDDEGHALAVGIGAVELEHVDHEGGVEGGDPAPSVPEVEGLVEEDSAGKVGKGLIAAGGVLGNLDGTGVDGRGGDDHEGGVVGRVEGTPFFVEYSVAFGI